MVSVMARWCVVRIWENSRLLISVSAKAEAAAAALAALVVARGRVEPSAPRAETLLIAGTSGAFSVLCLPSISVVAP